MGEHSYFALRTQRKNYDLIFNNAAYNLR